MFIEQSFTGNKSGDMNKNFDDDGREKRTGYSMLYFYFLYTCHDTYNINTYMCAYEKDKYICAYKSQFFLCFCVGILG